MLIRALTTGGAERQVTLLARGLSARGHEVTVVVFYGNGDLARELEETAVHVKSLAKRSRWDVIGFAMRLVRTVREARTQVVYAFLPTSNVLAAALSAFLGEARVVWGVRSTEMRAASYDWLGRRIAAAETSLSSRARLVICNSRAALQLQLQRGVPREKLTVIRNILDHRRFIRSAEARRELRRRWCISPDSVAVGIVGRLDPMKGHEVFLRAAAASAGSRSVLHFVVVGNGSEAYETELRRIAAAVGVAERVTWMAATAEVVAVYSALDVVCSASIYGEGFSNVLCEGMACGCLPIATDVGDAAEIVAGHGKVVRPGSVSDLAAGFDEVPSLLAILDRAAMREHIELLCGADTIVRQTEVALESIVERM